MFSYGDHLGQLKYKFIREVNPQYSILKSRGKIQMILANLYNDNVAFLVLFPRNDFM